MQLQQLKQVDAATKLGISLTALKKACRRLGFDKWPYCRIRSWSKYDCSDLMKIDQHDDSDSMSGTQDLIAIEQRNEAVVGMLGDGKQQQLFLQWRIGSDADLLNEALNHVEQSACTGRSTS